MDDQLVLPLEIIEHIFSYCDTYKIAMISHYFALKSGRYTDKLLAHGLWKCYNKDIIYDTGKIKSIKYHSGKKVKYEKCVSFLNKKKKIYVEFQDYYTRDKYGYRNHVRKICLETSRHILCMCLRRMCRLFLNYRNMSHDEIDDNSVNSTYRYNHAAELVVNDFILLLRKILNIHGLNSYLYAATNKEKSMGDIYLYELHYNACKFILKAGLIKDKNMSLITLDSFLFIIN